LTTQEFQKYEIDLPAIDDNCKNGKCNHKHKHTITNAPDQPKIQSVPPLDPPATAPAQAPAPNEIRTDHKELSELMPRPVNYAECSDGNCGHEIITNSKITKKFKECPNCNSNGVPSKHKFCPTCKAKEPTNEDEKEDFWNESSIDSEKIEDED